MIETIEKHLDGIEDKIDTFIHQVTGLHVREINTPEKRLLRLGKEGNDPIEIGFYPKRHPDMKPDDMRWSMYVQLLQSLTEMMKGGAEFEIWCHYQKLK